MPLPEYQSFGALTYLGAATWKDSASSSQGKSARNLEIFVEPTGIRKRRPSTCPMCVKKPITCPRSIFWTIMSARGVWQKQENMHKGVTGNGTVKIVKTSDEADPDLLLWTTTLPYPISRWWHIFMRHQQEILEEPTQDDTECQVHMSVGSSDHSASFSGWFLQRFSKNNKPRSPTKPQLAF